MTELQATAVDTAARSPHFVTDVPPILVGSSAAIERLREDVVRVAARNQPVLIVGEAGSGKSLLARAMHEQGPRADRSCARVACEALPETLLDLELFGCGPGSGRGVTTHRAGILAASSGGTVILENINATSERTHRLLSRFLASGQGFPIGVPGAGKPVNTRVVATCTVEREAGAEVPSALASMLGAILIRVPSLRERRSDVTPLTHYFADSSSAEPCGPLFSAGALTALTSYSWPGNVRQLKIVVERLVRTIGAREIGADDLPVGIRPRGNRGSRNPARSVGEKLFDRLRVTRESFWSCVYPLFMTREITRSDLRALVRTALESVRGNTDELVRVLNMPGSDRARFIRFLRKYGCELSS